MVVSEPLGGREGGLMVPGLSLPCCPQRGSPSFYAGWKPPANSSQHCFRETLISPDQGIPTHYVQPLTEHLQS